MPSLRTTGPPEAACQRLRCLDDRMSAGFTAFRKPSRQRPWGSFWVHRQPGCHGWIFHAPSSVFPQWLGSTTGRPDAFGLYRPRRQPLAGGRSVDGQGHARGKPADLLASNLIFFNTLAYSFSHAGIYLSEGGFLPASDHAPLFRRPGSTTNTTWSALKGQKQCRADHVSSAVRSARRASIGLTQRRKDASKKTRKLRARRVAICGFQERLKRPAEGLLWH